MLEMILWTQHVTSSPGQFSLLISSVLPTGAEPCGVGVSGSVSLWVGIEGVKGGPRKKHRGGVRRSPIRSHLCGGEGSATSANFPCGISLRACSAPPKRSVLTHRPAIMLAALLQPPAQGGRIRAVMCDGVITECAQLREALWTRTAGTGHD
jgi:hypothetical protein